MAAYAKAVREEFGYKPKPGIRVQVEGRLLDGSFRGVVGRPAQTVTLAWGDEEFLEGFCSCPDASDCVHCLVLAEHLASAFQTRGRSPDKAVASIKQRVKAVLKRRLKAD